LLSIGENYMAQAENTRYRRGYVAFVKGGVKLDHQSGGKIGHFLVD